MFVASGTQREMRIRHIFMCDLSDSETLFHIIPQRARFSKNVFEHNVFSDFSLQPVSETFLIL